MMSATIPGTDAARSADRALAGQDAGLLLIRGVIGLLFIGHGTGKLFGWFGQGGVRGTGAFFESVGYSPGETLAILAGITETVAGLLLTLGLLTPLGAAAIIGVMVNAAMVKSANGFWIADNGFEYELVIVVTMLALALAGPGGYSLDQGRPWSRGPWFRVGVAAVLGFGAGLIMLAMRA
jgi:putative oxidoreductase